MQPKAFQLDALGQGMVDGRDLREVEAALVLALCS